VDCDVLQADGGTRALAISGAYVALSHAFRQLLRRKLLRKVPFTSAVAAVSVGLVDGEALLDLTYQEDARADVDFNVAMTDRGELVEVQGAAEGNPFTRQRMSALLDLAEGGIRQLLAIQQEALQELGARG
jgi:ribonuclease PH